MIYYYVETRFVCVRVDKDEYMSCLKHARKHGISYSIYVRKHPNFSNIFLS